MGPLRMDGSANDRLASKKSYDIKYVQTNKTKTRRCGDHTTYMCRTKADESEIESEELWYGIF